MENKIQKYNKDDKLIEFIEINDNGEEIAHYTANGNRLHRISYDIDEDGVLTKKNSVIEFNEDIHLSYLQLKDYYVIRAKGAKGGSPEVLSRIDLSKDSYVNSFTIKSDLINSWLDL